MMTTSPINESSDLEDCLNLSEQQNYDALCSSNIDLIELDKTAINFKISALKSSLEKDLTACDLKWSLFVAASKTFRFDSCLKPFPPMYMKSDVKDIDALRATIDSVPPLPHLLEELKDENIVYEDKNAEIELLFWVLVRLGNPTIQSIKRDKHDLVLNQVTLSTEAAMPNLIFEISNNGVGEIRWKDLSEGQKTFFAFHGSKLENFYSIINYGLQQHMCQTHFFGKGIYLSSELSVSLHYSRNGMGWKSSVFGENMSCVVLCEIIDHPDVKIGSTDDETRNLAPESMGGKIPNKYVLVLNNELLRIRYLLVYSKDYGCSRFMMQRGVFGWLREHKLMAIMFAYIFLLVAVGLSRNRSVQRYYKMLVNKFGFYN